MSTRLNLAFAVALHLAFTGGAAASTEPESTLTRAEVIAALHVAQADGSLHALHGEDGGSHWMASQPFRSTVNRAQVLADARDAQRSGLIQAVVGEASPLDLDSFWLAPGITQFAGLHRWRDGGDGTGLPQRLA